MDATREDVERTIAEELRSHHQKTGAWVKAMAESQGDFERARKRYREMRLAELCADRVGDDLQRLRTELRYELARQDKVTVYGVLELSPDAADTEVAAAIADLIVKGGTLGAETRYAVEVLGDATRRADYDRQLLNQLRMPRPGRQAIPAADLRSGPRTDAGMRRSGRDFLLGLGAAIAILTYFGTEHYRDLRKLEKDQELAERQAAASLARRNAREARDDARAVVPVSSVPTVQAAN